MLKWPESPSSVSRLVRGSAPHRFVSSVLPLAFLSSPSLCCSSNLNISVFVFIKFYNSQLFPAHSPWPSPNTHSQLAEFLSFISPILASLLLLEIPQVRHSTLLLPWAIWPPIQPNRNLSAALINFPIKCSSVFCVWFLVSKVPVSAPKNLSWSLNVLSALTEWICYQSVCCKSTGFSFKHSINTVQSRDGLASIWPVYSK